MISIKKIIIIIIALLFFGLLVYGVKELIKDIPEANNPTELLISDDGINFKYFSGSFEGVYHRFIIEGPTEGIYRFSTDVKIKSISINGDYLDKEDHGFDTLDKEDYGFDTFLYLPKEKNIIEISTAKHPSHLSLNQKQQKTKQYFIFYVCLIALGILLLICCILLITPLGSRARSISFFLLILVVFSFLIFFYLFILDIFSIVFYPSLNTVEYSTDGIHYEIINHWREGISTPNNSSFVRLNFSKSIDFPYFIGVEPREKNIIQKIYLNERVVCSKNKTGTHCYGTHHMPFSLFKRNIIYLEIENQGEEMEIYESILYLKEDIKLKIRHYLFFSLIAFGLIVPFNSLLFKGKTIVRKKGFLRQFIEK